MNLLQNDLNYVLNNSLISVKKKNNIYIYICII